MIRFALGVIVGAFSAAYVIGWLLSSSTTSTSTVRPNDDIQWSYTTGTLEPPFAC